MAKVSNEEKLSAVKDWLRENNIEFVENYKSSFGVMIDVKIPSLMIAVFMSNGNSEVETSIYYSNSKRARLYWMYRPFFIRSSETKEFVLEKIQNCCYDRMMAIQRKMEREQQKKENIERQKEIAAQAAARKAAKEAARQAQQKKKRKRARIVRYEKV